ncbi:MAG: hypothetical protein ACRCU2_26565 [Planktothrix sp.]
MSYIYSFLQHCLVFKIINLGHELHIIFTHYLLPITYYLLPITQNPLPITYYPLPIRSCHVFEIITSPTIS